MSEPKHRGRAASARVGRQAGQLLARGCL